MIHRHALFVLLASTSLGGCGSENAGDSPPAGSSAVAQRLNPEQVPEGLRHLVPLAEKWGIGDDVDRNAKVESATPAERSELRAAITPAASRITTWLDSFAQGAMSDEAAAFMYMRLALEEMPADGSP
jgi:hypothetical protein